MALARVSGMRAQRTRSRATAACAPPPSDTSAAHFMPAPTRVPSAGTAAPRQYAGSALGCGGGRCSSALARLSRNAIRGALTRTGTRAKRSCRSLTHRSRCTSPAAPTTSSPVGSCTTSTKGSAWLRSRRPASSCGRSVAQLGSTATRTMGAAGKDIGASARESGVDASVALLRIRDDNPAMATRLPAGTLSTGSSARPIGRKSSTEPGGSTRAAAASTQAASLGSWAALST
mmetsp:Transcript_7569/g.30741  ORF Transcript_7569/g.30741 Transcript_7569/m.30741 type:complete len:232 (-) Transcript_7569:1531-2226(-)